MPYSVSELQPIVSADFSNWPNGLGVKARPWAAHIVSPKHSERSVVPDIRALILPVMP